MIVRVVLLLAVSLIAQGAGPGDGPDVYDFYEKGIKRGEVVVDRAEETVSVRTLDRTLRAWSGTSTLPWAQTPGSLELRLEGAIRDLPGRIPELENAGWGSFAAVGWPTAETIYEPHRSLDATVEGVAVSASHWVERDASQPMDLIIADNGTLVAGIDPANDFVLVRRGYEAFTTLAGWTAAGVSPPRFTLADPGRYQVATDDGPSLATLVYLPQGDGATGPWPTILVRSPYGIGNLIDTYWHHVARGYAVVLQAARGTAYWDPDNRSEGDWGMRNEPADGAKALQWIAEQPWSDGQVCMQGGSYLGYTQWAASMAKNPALRCLVPEVSMGTVFSDQPYMGGGFVEGLAYYAFFMLDEPVDEGLTWTEILAHRPLAEIDSYATGEDIPLWNALLGDWRNDESWRVQDWYRDEGSRDFSTLQISGWFDDDFPGTRANWELMQQRGVGPQRLLIGPWKHGYNVDRQLNGFSFGADAVRPDIWLLKQKWYDHILKGLDNDVTEPRVEYFVLGSNEWRSATQWPPPESVTQPWYFHSGGSANLNTVDGVLTTEAPSDLEPFEEYRYDPADPPKNWYSFDLMESWQDVQSFPYDFKDIEARHDVATFTSKVLDEELTIAGDILVDLHASTDVLDTDWWVHVSDVHPDNSSVRLSVGLLRARFRNLDDPEQRITGSNFQVEELLSGDLEEVVRYRIAIPAIANTFRTGHRIRIAVFNALDNYSFPNSNTGADEALVTETVVGTMRIHHEARYPSRVLLPVMPR